MPRCDTCGNEYEKTFDVIKGGEQYTFDSFECAIQELAPTCDNCGTRVIGHGKEDNGSFYCCSHCMEQGTR